VTFRALEDGAIDAYPEYTGTIAETITHGPADLASLRAALDAKGLAISEPIGFQNTYALAVRKDMTHLRILSDLALAPPDTVYGLSHEFMGRTDGWPALASRYGLHPKTVTTLDHALAYEGLVKGKIDVTDVYTTDAKIAKGVRVAFVVSGADAPSISYPIAVLAESSNKTEAQRFVAFLESAEAKAIFVRYGFVVK